MELAAVGGGAGGSVTRLALSEDDLAATELVSSWVAGAGCVVRRDGVGNLFARWPGTDDRLAPVMIGSHLDSQRDGGRFDGALGVVGAVEVLAVLADYEVQLSRSIELVAWMGEEGSRFDVSCIGSSVFAGLLDIGAARDLVDSMGVSLGSALDASKMKGADHRLPTSTARAYLELHIEQGPLLEERGHAIGVVTGIQGITWQRLAFIGREGHAGTVPMSARRDALAGMIDFGSQIGARVRTEDGADLATICELRVTPNAGSVIPSRAECLVDLRHPSNEKLDALRERLEALGADVARRRDLSFETETAWQQPAIDFDQELVGIIDAVARRAGAPASRLVSGAGHDAGPLATAAPSAMIFIPCRGGISHHRDEWADPDACATGVQILLDTALAVSMR